jgi:hypothetical protein
MTEHKSEELKRRRDELTKSLPALGQERAETYRLNSDALALDRAGVKTAAPQEMARLQQEQEAADVAVRDAQRELRQLDTEMENEAGSRRGGRLGRAFGRVRGDR